jgi:hypothetical protein
LLKDKLLNLGTNASEECSTATHILANLPLSDDEVKNVLGVDLIGCIVNALKEQREGRAVRNSWAGNTMVDGLLHS